MYVGIVSCCCLGIFFSTLLLYCSWHPDSNMHSGALYLLSMRMYAQDASHSFFTYIRKGTQNFKYGFGCVGYTGISHFSHIQIYWCFSFCKKSILLPLLIIHVIHSMHQFKKIYLVCQSFDWFVCFDNENARYADIRQRII